MLECINQHRTDEVHMIISVLQGRGRLNDLFEARE